MKGIPHPSIGLIGRIFAILLLAVTIEFGATTFFHERESRLSVRDDEARRLAEHLVIARKFLSEHPAAERSELAEDLTTSRYEVRWSEKLPPPLKIAPTLDRIHTQVVTWEPSLAKANVRLRLTGPARDAVIVGGLTLPDGSWMTFATREPVHDLGFSFERLLFGLAPAVAMVLIGGLLVRQTLMPLRRLTRAAEHVGGDSAEEVPESGTREVRRLIGSFNRMQARIHRLIEDRTQALAAVGHDLRTPLARLRLRADAIKDDDIYQAMEDDLTEMQAMIDSLLEYYGGDANGEAAVRIDLAVMCATIADDYRDRGHDVRYAGPRHLDLTVRRSAIKRALGNLVENGLHYGKRVWITIEAQEKVALIRVEDDGPGIPEDSLDMVLQPFVRLDHARARDTVGLGLGLSIVKRTVDAERGKLTLSNREKGGLRAEICLPIV